MAQSIEDSLIKAIKKDDIKAFNALTEKARSGVYRLGRFPILSLMYLYKSRRILYEYEQRLLKVSDYEELGEPVEVSKKFSARAGKCLRLYLSEVVTPPEMLLILDKTRRLKRVYPLTKPTEEVKKRLKSIYYIKYSLNVKFEGESIIIDRRPLSYREKKKIATVCACCVLAAALSVGVPVTAVSLMPEPVEGEVKKLSQIDFDSTNEYTLKRDIVVPENYGVKKVNCKITGGGHKLVLKSGATLGELNGRVSDLVIESTGEAIFTTVSESATIEGVTVNISANLSVTENSALVAVTNYGTIDGVTVNVTGTVTAQAGGEITFGGIALSNSYKAVNFFDTVSGTIKNCTVNYSQFSFVGGAGAAFGGVAGVNDGNISDCTVTGEINVDAFYIGGVCFINRGGVESCKNSGNISVSFESGEAYVGGITALAYGYIYKSENEGSITVNGGGNVYAGGISAHSHSQFSYCYSDGDITVAANGACVGGIFGFSEIDYQYGGSAEYCISKNKIDVTVEETPAYIGGIAGYVGEKEFINGYFGGRVINCYFIGELASIVNYSGSIVGVCGANIYGGNANFPFGDGNINFDGNYYLNNTAFGAAEAGEEQFNEAEDKGATLATLEDIKRSENYNKILAELEKTNN